MIHIADNGGTESFPNRYYSYVDTPANAHGALLGLAHFAVEARIPYVALHWRAWLDPCGRPDVFVRERLNRH